MKDREHWKSRSVFLMAAVGSAIGLGNLWRFPYIAAQNGGGAFLVPYFIALVTAGIPIMIIEYGLGIRAQSSANVALGVIRPVFRYVGWMAILGAFTINVYYCAVMGWSWVYLFDAFSIKDWGGTIASSHEHFFTSTLGLSDGPMNLGGFRWPILAGLLGTWFLIWFIIKGGLGRIGKVLLFTVPVPVALILILAVRGVTLDGAATGLNHYLAPDWAKLRDPSVWLAAYGQIFFSLSLGFGTMIAYASFMPRTTEIPNSAAITAFSNCAFSFLAGFAVFSVLGYFAVAANVDIHEVTKNGPGLAFVVYPAALSQLPFYVTFFAVLFFLSLLLLGIDSAFSLLETVATAVSDKFDISRARATTIVAGISALLGLPFATQAGLYWLDIVDHFVLSYLITFIGIAECIIVGYFFGIKPFAAEVNRHAEIRIGMVFSLLVKIVTPLVLCVIFVLSVIQELKTPYEGYPKSALILLGLGSLVLVTVGAGVLGSVRTRSDEEWARLEQKLKSPQAEDAS